MSTPDKAQVQTDIKLEDGVTIVQENVTDIQNYLDTFNKEIQGGDQVVQQVGVVAADDGGAEEGTYYVDQAGQYYYQSPACDGQQVMTVVSGIPGASGEGGESFVALPASAASAQRDNGGSSTTPLLIQTAAATTSGGGSTVATTTASAATEGAAAGGATYQTVTIVPSETNPGELSYLLIVQQPGDDEEGADGEPKDKDDDEDHDLTVYDFDDAEDVGAVSGMESGEEDDKSKIVKFVPKKSQTVTQAHMCNYCNYTSPKRYLLSRHMKSHSEERPHKCSVCERGFKTLASLQNHVNTHTGTKPHRCKHCDSAFTTSGELVRHVRYKHTHEKPHKCTICDYASVELSKMRNHMRCHTGERPYQVGAAQVQLSGCSARSKRSLAWDYFTEVDANSAMCLLCSRVIRHYNGTRNLLVHVRRVHVAATSKQAKQDDSDEDTRSDTAEPQNSDQFEISGRGVGISNPVPSVVELGAQNSEISGVEISNPESSIILDYQTNPELEIISERGIDISEPSLSSIVEYGAETNAGFDVEISGQPLTSVIEFGSTQLEDGSGVEISESPVIDYGVQASRELEIQSVSSAVDYDGTTGLQAKPSVPSVIDYNVQTNEDFERSGCGVVISEQLPSTTYEAQTAESENRSAVVPSPSDVDFGTETNAGLGTVSTIIISSTTDNPVLHYTNQDNVELQTVSNVLITSQPDSRIVDAQVSTDQEVQGVLKETIFPSGESSVVDYQPTGVEANSEVQYVSNVTNFPNRSIVIGGEATMNSKVQPVSNKSDAELLVSDYEVQTASSNVIVASNPVTNAIVNDVVNSELDKCSTVVISSSSGIDYEVTSAELKTIDASIPPKPVVDSPKPSTSDLAEEFPLQKLQIILLFFEKIDVTNAICTVCRKSVAHKGYLKPVLHHLLRNHRSAVSDAMRDQASCVAKLNSVYENLQEAVTVVLTVFEKDAELWSCDSNFRVWKYYYRTSKLVAMCLLCFCDFKISKTVDNLVKHLKRNHPTVSVEDLEDNSSLQGGSKRKCKVVSDEMGDVWAYFVKKNDRIALCTLCPTNVYFLNNNNILSNHLTVKHGIVFDKRLSSNEKTGSELLGNSDNNDKKLSERPNKVLVGRKILETSSKVVFCKKYLDKALIKKRLLETSKTAIVGRKFLQSCNKNLDERKLAKTNDEVHVERKLIESSPEVLAERNVKSSPKVIVEKRSVESSSEVEVGKRVPVSSSEFEGKLSVSSPEVIVEKKMSERYPEVIVENYDSRKSLKMTSTNKRHSIVWQHFKEVSPRLAQCHLCKKNVESFGSTGALLRHLRKFHVDVLGENVSNPQKSNKSQRSFVWEYFTRESQKSSICNLCKWVVRGENTGNLIHHLKRRHEQDLAGKPIGLWLMSAGGGRKNEKKKTDKKKKGGKKPSIVWSYFIEKDDVTASCLLCKRDIKHYKTTKNLLEHLRRIHPHTLKLNKDGGDDDYVTAGSEVGEELPFIETVTDADFQPTSSEVPPPNSSRKVVSEPRGSGNKSSTFISKHFIKFQDNIYLCKSCQNTIENVKSLRKLSDHLRSAHKGMLDGGCVAAAIDNLDDVSNSTCASSAVLNSELNTILETLEKSGDKSEEPMSGFKKEQHQSIVLKSFSRKDETTVTCLFCGEDIERFCGINNLLDHLESKHPDYQLIDSLTIPFATTSDSQLVEIDDNGLLKNLNTFDCGAEESDHQMVLSKEDMFLNKNLDSFNDGNNQQLSLSKSDELFVEKNLNSFNFSTEASDQQLVLNKDVEMFVEKNLKTFSCNDEESGQQLVLNKDDEMFVEKNFDSFNCNSEATDQNLCINDESFMDKETRYIVATDAVLSGKQLDISEKSMILIEKSDGTFDTSGNQVGLHENAETFIENNPNSFGKNYVISCGQKVINENSELFMETSNNDELSGNNVVFSGKQLGVNEKSEIFSEKSDNTFNTSDVATSGKQLSINEKGVFFESLSCSFNASDGVFTGKGLGVGKNHEMFVENATYPFETNHIVTANKQLELDGNNVEESNQFDKNDVVISGKQLRIDENGDLFVEKPTDSYETSGIMGVEKLHFNESNGEIGIDEQTNSFNTNDSSCRDFVIDGNGGILVGKPANSFETNKIIITEQQLEFNENSVAYLENEGNSFKITDTAITDVMNANDMIVSGKKLLINEEQNNSNTDVSVATYNINDVIVGNEQLHLNEGESMFIEEQKGSFNTGSTAVSNTLDSNDNRQIVFNADGETFSVKEAHPFMTDHDLKLNGRCEMQVENETNNIFDSGHTLDMNERDETGFVRNPSTSNFNTGEGDNINVEACKYLVSNTLCGIEQVTNLVENQLNNFNQNETVGESHLVENQLNFNENLVNVGVSERGMVGKQLSFNEDNGENSELPNMDMVVDSINQMDLEGIADDFLKNVVPGRIEMSVIGDENRVENSSLVNGSDAAAASLTFEYQTKDDIRSLCSLICNCDVWGGKSGDIVSHMRATHGVILKHSPKEQVQKEGNAKQKKKVKEKNDAKTEKKKVYKKRSVIWRYFVEKDEKTATCLRCGIDFSRSSSRNLLTHLRRKHAIGCEEISSASNICRNSTVVKAISKNSGSVKREKNVKKSSVVWKYFKETKGSSDSCGYLCVLCNEDSGCNKFSTVLNMRNHLRQVHGIIFKKRPKRFSYVWKYFRVDEEAGDDQNCTCTLCGKELKNYSDVRVLKNHLKNSHADVFNGARQEKDEEDGLSVDVVVTDRGVSDAGLKSVAVIVDSNIEDVVEPMFDVDYKRHKRKRSKVWSYFSDANDTTCVCKLCSVLIKHFNATPNLIEHMRRVHPGVLSENELQKRSKEAPKKSVVWKHFRKDDENSKAHVVCKLCDVRIKHNHTTKKLVSHIRKLHHEVYLKDLVKSRQSQTVAQDLNNGELFNTITVPSSKKRKGENKKKSSTKTQRKNVTDEASQTIIPYTEGNNVKHEQPHTTKTHRRKNAKSSKVKESTIVKNIDSVSKNTSVGNFLNSRKLEVVKIGHLENVIVDGSSNPKKAIFQKLVT